MEFWRRLGPEASFEKNRFESPGRKWNFADYRMPQN